MTNEELLEKIERIVKSVLQGQAEIKTAVEALSAGQEDIREKLKEVELKIELTNARAAKTDTIVNKIDDGLTVMQPKIFEMAKDRKECIEKIEAELGHSKN